MEVIEPHYCNSTFHLWIGYDTNWKRHSQASSRRSGNITSSTHVKLEVSRAGTFHHGCQRPHVQQRTISQPIAHRDARRKAYSWTIRWYASMSLIVYVLHIVNNCLIMCLDVTSENRRVKLAQAKNSLDKLPPSTEESRLIHELFLESTSETSDTPTVLMEDTKITSTIFCQPQNRNIHGFIFGGFLMQRAYELAFSNALLYIRDRPEIIALDDTTFRKPVPVGSILKFSSKVVYAEGHPHHTFQVAVVADVIDPTTGQRDTTNTFYFSFSSRKIVPRLQISTYSDAVDYIDGRRRKLHGIALTANFMKWFVNKINVDKS